MKKVALKGSLTSFVHMLNFVNIRGVFLFWSQGSRNPLNLLEMDFSWEPKVAAHDREGCSAHLSPWDQEASFGSQKNPFFWTNLEIWGVSKSL